MSSERYHKFLAASGGHTGNTYPLLLLRRPCFLLILCEICIGAFKNSWWQEVGAKMRRFHSFAYLTLCFCAFRGTYRTYFLHPFSWIWHNNTRCSASTPLCTSLQERNGECSSPLITGQPAESSCSQWRNSYRRVCWVLGGIIRCTFLTGTSVCHIPYTPLPGVASCLHNCE